MRHLARYSLLIAILICSTAFGLAQDGKPLPGEIVTDRPAPEYDPKSWKAFSSKEGRFTVLLPGTPEKNVRTYESPYGKLDEHSFSLKTFALYAVIYTDYPEKDGLRDVRAFFAGVREGHLRALNGQLLEEKEDNRAGYAGHIIKVRAANGYVSRLRVYLVGNRAYILFVIMPEQNAGAESLKFYEETAMKFLDSFKPEVEFKNVYDRFGDPRTAAPPLLPSTGINIDPVIKLEGEPSARVNAGILNRKALSLPQPAYSPEAKAAGASGEVKIKVVIDESGKVIWARPIAGHELLQKAAQDAAYQATFKPTTIDGKPERVSGVLVYTFRQ